MKAVQLCQMIEFLVINSWNIPSQSAPFCCSEVFHRMEGETGEVGNTTYHFSMPGRTKGMSRISTNCDAAYSLLYCIRCLE